MKKQPRPPGPRAAKAKKPEKTAPTGPRPSRKPVRRTGMDVRLSPRNRVSLYAASRYLTSSVKEACRLRIPFLTYFKDPAVAKSNPSSTSMRILESTGSPA